MHGLSRRFPLIDAYIGHAKDDSISLVTGGGGIVTAVTAYALQRGILDDALMVSSGPEHVFPFPKLCTTVDDVMSCAGSKYVRTPYGELLSKAGRRTAVVGNSCSFKDDCEYLKIGLFTGLCNSKKAYGVIMTEMGISEKDVLYISFRHIMKGRMMNIFHMKDGKVRPFRTGWWNYVAFTDKASDFAFSPKCMSCDDYHCRDSDLSVGDYDRGRSLILIHTDRGRDFIGSVAQSVDIQRYYYDPTTDPKHFLLYDIKELKGGFKSIGPKRFNRKNFRRSLGLT